MSLLDVLPKFTLPGSVQQLLPPDYVGHIQSVISLTISTVGIYIFTAGAIYTTLWPQVLFFHPKYLPRSRLRTVPQVRTEVVDSLYNIAALSIITYPVLYAQRGRFAPASEALPSSATGQLAAAVWFACDIVGYLIHSTFHSSSFLYKYVHKNAHQWPVPTPFALFTSSPIDMFIRVVLPPLLVPFFFRTHVETYALVLLAAYGAGVIFPELSQASLGLLSRLVHSRSARFLHAISPAPYVQDAKARQEINPFTLATSGAVPPPSIEPPSKVVNIATLTAIPDYVFGSYMFASQDPVDQAEFSSKAWRSSKEALGTKERKVQRGGWGKVDRWAGDGVGRLQTVSAAAVQNHNQEEDGDVDGLLG